MSDTNFVSRTVRISFLCLGLLENRNYRLVYSVWVTLCSISIFGSIVGVLNSTGADIKLEALTSLFPQLNGMLLFVTINASKKNLLLLLAKLKEFPKSDILERSNEFTKKELIWCFVTLATQCVCFAAPSLLAPFLGGEINDKYSYIIPFWFSCGDRDSNERTVAVCLRIHSGKELFVANMVQGMCAGWHMIIYTSSFALYGIIAGELVVHSESIRTIVNEINEQDKIDWTNTKPRALVIIRRREENNYQKLLEIIEYQQFSHSCISKTINIWTPYLACYYGAFLINLTNFLFITIKEHDNSKSFVIKVSFLTFFGVQIAFLLSNYSQTISMLNQNIFDEMVNLKWYEQNLRFRKIYMTVLTLTLKPVRIVAGGAFQVNLNSFMSMLRTVYSILNVLIIKYG